jgi:hypothetical protein
MDDTMTIVIKVFLVLGRVAVSRTMIPLAWMISITVNIIKKLNTAILSEMDGKAVCWLS